MNILHIFRAPVGGLLRHVLDLSEQLTADGHNVFFIFSDSCLISEKNLTRIEQISKGEYLRLGMTRLPSFGDIFVIKKAFAWISHREIDVVHGHGAKGGFYARFLKAFGFGAKTIYTPHGGSLHYNKNSILGHLFFAIERWMSKYTDSVIFESVYAKKIYTNSINIVPSKVSVVHNGLGSNEFSDSSAVAKKIDFLFLGELRKLKGVDLLLRAIKILNEKGYFPTCSIVGAGPDAAYFLELSKEFELVNTSFPGSTSEPSSVMEVSRCFILPSYEESLPYVVLEAVALNIPVIAADVGGVSEILAEKINMFPRGDYLVLASIMESFLFDESPHKLTSLSNMNFVYKNFNAKKMANDVLRVYNS